ncbi:MAG: hypothetical protein IGQ88_03760 [Gloeomargaritaceae cyanobacterium C42_A2020_066]|nr:hypothetical protein [Gloeomargaritaceae cyanobacterium C42_A2020_066]
MAITQNPQSIKPGRPSPAIRDVAYSLDALVPGFYLWVGTWAIRIGGCPAEPGYPGTIHAPAGLGIVLPGYRVWTTYQGSYDP